MNIRLLKAVAYVLSVFCIANTFSVFSYSKDSVFDYITVEAAGLDEWNSYLTNSNIKWKISNNSTLVISGNGEIPEFEMNGGWGKLVLDGSVTIKNIVIESGITSIGAFAFSGGICDQVESVYIPNTVTNIGKHAFSGCYKLNKLNIPNSVTKIGESAFMYDENIVSISIPDSVTSIGLRAFCDCKKLTTVKLPDSIKNMGMYVFQRCTGLTQVVLPNSLKTIEFGTFSGCTSLKKITIPDSVTKIDGQAFTGCSTLNNVVIPDKTETIEDEAFYGCESLTDIIISNNVKKIGATSFCHCSKLTNLELPESVSSIGHMAFSYDSDLELTVKNPECVFYNYNNNGVDGIGNVKSIRGYDGSTAEIYANIFKVDFISLSERITQPQGGSYQFSLSNLDLKSGDTLNVNISGDVGDTIQVNFYYTDKNGNASSSLVGGLGGTVLDSNGKKTVSFTAPNDLNSISVKITYNKSLPTYTYDIKRKEIVTQPTTTQITTTTTKETTTTTKKTTVTTTTKQTTTTSTTTTNTENKSFQVGIDDYSFENYTGKITLSDSSLAVLEKNINNLDWDEVEKYLSGKSAYGHCYGMAAVQILTKADVLNAADIDSAAKTLYDVSSPKSKKSVDDILNYYVVLQKTRVIQSRLNKYSRKTNQVKVTELMELAENVKSTGKPILVCFEYTDSSSAALEHKYEGHAVVAYGIEHGSYYNGQYDCRVLISDSNVIGFKNECCIYINSKTYAWQIPYYQEKRFSCTNNNENDSRNPYAKIRLITDDLTLINYPKSNISTDNSTDSTISIENNSTNYGVAYYDKNTSGSINADVVDLLYISGGYGGDFNNTVHAILPESDVAYEYFEKSLSPFNTTIEYTNSKLSADVSNGNYAVYRPNESVEFHGKNSTYTLSMTLNSGYHPTDWYKIEVDGENASEAKISKAGEGYIISSDNLSDGIIIKTSNRNNTARLGVIANCNSILAYEIDEDTIGIKLDINNDGIYETKYEPDYIGDVNSDGKFSIADAVLLQRYLLNIDSINRTQFIKADINMDGAVNVFDMCFIRRMLIQKTS